ncbi:MAG TPA: hypothetical protein VFJ74_08450 [Gemmatimonadaceae bacterium]|nr:hypothetical protein [Gemmatimonadaceae bacterium]
MPGSALPPEDDDERDERDEHDDDIAEDPEDRFGDDDEQDEEEEEAEGPSGEAVFVTTATPVQIRVAPLADERVPDGSALAAYLGERMIARCAMPREAVDRLMELDLFARPLPLALLAYEEEPGLQCRLFALVPTTALADSDSEDEPWKGSVPSYEDALAASEGDDDDDDSGETEVAPILLGNIVRFAIDRKHPEDLTAEAVDILQKVIAGGPLADANSKAIDDLLGSL